MTDALLTVQDLRKTYIRSHHGNSAQTTIYAVRHVSFALQPGEILCVVGESGCGKSTVGKMVADIVPPTSGAICLSGQNLLALRGAERDRVSLGIQFIHQDPFAALNPTRTIAQSLSAPLKMHQHLRSTRARLDRLSAVLETVGLSPAAEILTKYPHQLSGGQRQRVVIARALTVYPKVIVADEATSMVDVSLRVGILQTLLTLADTLGVGFLFITHDFSVARYFGYGQRLAVMYLGQFVEMGLTENVVAEPAHPYTTMLLSAVPLPDPTVSRLRRRLRPSSEEVPDATEVATGCVFLQRCPFATEVCSLEAPPLQDIGEGHWVACHHVDQVETATMNLRSWR